MPTRDCCIAIWMMSEPTSGPSVMSETHGTIERHEMDQRIPRQLGYRWPAEWEPHRATWLSWPHARETWPGLLSEAQQEFAELVRTIDRYEPVELLVPDDRQAKLAQETIGSCTQLTLHLVPTNDAWIRDYGPTFLQGPPGEAPALVHWRYNAWGGKYPPFDDDATVARWMADYLRYRRFHPEMVLEGGAIDGNGESLLVTTENCLLDASRNPESNRRAIEQLLRDYLSVDHIIWLKGGLAGDDTDGHIDQLVRFLDPRTLLVADRPTWNADPEWDFFAETTCRVDRFCAQTGLSLHIVPLPMPAPCWNNAQRLPASYANFLFTNGAVIVPIFGDANDDLACDLIRSFVADREVVPLSARYLVAGLGAFHCLSQQQPSP